MVHNAPNAHCTENYPTYLVHNFHCMQTQTVNT